MGNAVRLFITLFFVLFTAGPGSAGEVNLSVAASLKDVINELSEGFAGRNPGVKLLRNFGGSGALAKQIENGAPADIFISANMEWLEYLMARNLVESSGLGVFAYNTMVFAGAPDRKVSGMQDLKSLEKIAIGSPKSVPAGEYAMEALKKAGVVALLEKKLVMAKDVRECLMYAERGEVDGAFVYRTDALLAKRARILFTVPGELYPRVTYPMALTLTGTRNRDASAFFNYLHGEEARRVLVKYGFAVR